MEQQKQPFNSPEELFEDLHTRTLHSIVKSTENLKHVLGKLLNERLEIYQAVIACQSEELMYFHILESYVRNNTLTEEGLTAILNKLEEFRAKFKKTRAARRVDLVEEKRRVEMAKSEGRVERLAEIWRVLRRAETTKDDELRVLYKTLAMELLKGEQS
jgi:hypothetical protein